MAEVDDEPELWRAHVRAAHISMRKALNPFNVRTLMVQDPDEIMRRVHAAGRVMAAYEAEVVAIMVAHGVLSWRQIAAATGEPHANVYRRHRGAQAGDLADVLQELFGA